MNRPPTAEMNWSVRGLLEFSYVPEINAAFEGAWDGSGPERGNVDEPDEIEDRSWGGDADTENDNFWSSLLSIDWR